MKLFKKNMEMKSRKKLTVWMEEWENKKAIKRKLLTIYDTTLDEFLRFVLKEFEEK